MTTIKYLFAFISVTLFCSQSISQVSQPLLNSNDTAQSISVEFFHDSLAIKPEGLETMEYICERFEKKATDISRLKITLIPGYSIEEMENNRFIGVSRAKRVQEILISCYEGLNNKIVIKDIGTIDKLFYLCSGSILPTLSAETFKPLVIILFE